MSRADCICILMKYLPAYNICNSIIRLLFWTTKRKWCEQHLARKKSCYSQAYKKNINYDWTHKFGLQIIQPIIHAFISPGNTELYFAKEKNGRQVNNFCGPLSLVFLKKTFQCPNKESWNSMLNIIHIKISLDGLFSHTTSKKLTKILNYGTKLSGLFGLSQDFL